MGLSQFKPSANTSTTANMAAHTAADSAAGSAASSRQWIVIGISGVTCGGKTTLASWLRERLCPVFVLHQDKYFYPDDAPQHVAVPGLSPAHNNYDVLGALDMAAMLRDARCTLAGRARAHEHAERAAAQCLQLPGTSFLVLEGFTVLNYPPLMELCDLRYYITLEYGECLARRVFRLYDPPDVDGYFDQCVWPEHLKYKAQLQHDVRVHMLDGTRQDALDVVLADVRALHAQRGRRA